MVTIRIAAPNRTSGLAQMPTAAGQCRRDLTLALPEPVPVLSGVFFAAGRTAHALFE
jgi:hypothetical protein